MVLSGRQLVLFQAASDMKTDPVSGTSWHVQKKRSKQDSLAKSGCLRKGHRALQSAKGREGAEGNGPSPDSSEV